MAKLSSLKSHCFDLKICLIHLPVLDDIPIPPTLLHTIDPFLILKTYIPRVREIVQH